MALPPFGNFKNVVVSVFHAFPSYSQRDPSFHCIAYGYCRPDWDNSRDHLRDVSWKDIFKLGVSAVRNKFCKLV